MGVSPMHLFEENAWARHPCYDGHGRLVVNTLGVILARGGSKGLRNKHLLPLLGRPVIGYTFDHARAASSLTRVVVSTDSAEIRQLAAESFFETIQRPAELATDDASVQDVMLHAMHEVERRSSFR